MGRFEISENALEKIAESLREEYEGSNVDYVIEDMRISENGEYLSVLIRDDYDSRFLHIFDTKGNPLLGWKSGVGIPCQEDVVVFPGVENVAVFMKCGTGEIALYPFQDENPKEHALRVTFSRLPIYVSLTNMERVVIFGDMRLDFSAPADLETVFIPRLQGGYAFFHAIHDTDDEIYILHTFKEPGMKNPTLRIGRINYPPHPYYSPIEFWDGVETISAHSPAPPTKGAIGDIVLRDNEPIAVLGTKLGKELYILTSKKARIIPLPGELVFTKFTEKGLFLLIGQFRGYLYGGFVTYEDLLQKGSLKLDDIVDRTVFGRYNPEAFDPKFSGISRSGDVLVLGKSSGKVSASGRFYYYVRPDSNYLYSYVSTQAAPGEGDITYDQFTQLEEVLRRFGGVILYGPPGTGKTKLALDLSRDADKVEVVTFHQSYSYEDFVEGFRPVEKEGKLLYVVEDGILKRLAVEAIFRGLHPDEGEADYKKKKEAVLEYLQTGKGEFKPRGKFYLIIDEINRGNISRILGEVITLLDPDKRLGMEYETKITLPYSREPFALPPNLYIIGTMNSTDRSIAFLDMALRRRFAFLEILPRPEELGDIEVGGVNLQHLLSTLNRVIEEERGKDYTIGHGYFREVIKAKPEERAKALKDVFYYKILPLLQEYFYGNWEAIRRSLPGFGFIDEKGRIIEMDDDEFIEALRKLVTEK
ncbi:putative 5-methylcytosine restriction system, GTPase subunit [Thermococcus kodakarensis KOD1]|uniref:5-methylcytosine restriction system, GTPase subunit n=1 Tax=Thermococcus kodakarensis (strain ATCC BAA-918 / JCM 12380 / KOD1) TaxID=69014 RepID=Q5JH85_THEKO|nr:AAA family ATPase [Thermococcus kodakarensis]WCN31108.1 AAA family ATPase [Thermococcus kodakarensis]BAD84984.1 putative 5-methylcytosine restriction system, GTPase subunit [Thermococcus kodakarensis KOD1]